MKASAGMFFGGERIGRSLGVRALGGVGGVGEQRAGCRIGADRPEFGVGKAVAADDLGIDRKVMQLTGKQATFRVVAAEIDEIDLLSLDAGGQRGEVLVAGRDGVVDDFGDATSVQRCP